MTTLRRGLAVTGTVGKIARVGTWPMWVLGFAVMIDNIDQYIVRGTSNQIERAFGVGDFAIGVLFSAFIVVNGIATMPASYLGDRWNRTKIMAVTITAWSLISALGGVVPPPAMTPSVGAEFRQRICTDHLPTDLEFAISVHSTIVTSPELTPRINRTNSTYVEFIDPAIGVPARRMEPAGRRTPSRSVQRTYASSRNE
jgi:hypothetical protein